MTRELTLAAYGLVAVAAVLVQAVALVRRDLLPTLGEVVGWAMRRRSTQLALVLAWWWLGWHFITAR